MWIELEKSYIKIYPIKSFVHFETAINQREFHNMS